jgi:hypothetical protein
LISEAFGALLDKELENTHLEGNMKRIKFLAIALVVIGGALTGSNVASASEHTAFLCPVVGDGVLNADMNNGDNGVSVILPPVGTSFLPGKNKAGANANSNAHNSENPSNPDAGPGGNPDFSPIWPG